MLFRLARRKGTDREAAADRFDLGADIGALVIEVSSASPADIAGIAQRDATVRIDGADIVTAGYAAAAIADTLPGDVIELQVVRGRERIVIEATVGERPSGT